MKRKFAALPSVLVFVVVTTVLSGTVAVTLGRIKIQDSTTYVAEFEDVSGLERGSDVRAAGVVVGSVGDMDLDPSKGTVSVSFTVPSDLPLTTTTQARVRWANLTGDRYMDLTRGDSQGRPLDEEGRIPVARTLAALDLDDLFNGFKPLLQALSPDDVNALTSSLISVTEGQAGSVESLMAHLGSFTGTLADRDELIGSVIDNLSTVLTTIDDHKGDFDKIIVGLSGLLDGLAKDRHKIGSSLSPINTMTVKAQELLEVLRPELKATLKQVDRVAIAVNGNSDYVNEMLGKYPDVIAKLGRGGAYGSWFNFYLCALRVRLVGGENPVYTPFLMSEEPRCQP
ncbi:MAG TPA: MlaD family protein [Nocardioides sp.]